MTPQLINSSCSVKFRRKRRANVAWLILISLIFSAGCSKNRRREPARPVTLPGGAQTFTGRVVRIADGDTITVLDSTNTQHRIRLQGIDAPESHQAYGNQSKQNLSAMIFDKDVTVIYEKIDQYGRIVGKILLDGKDMNLEQVKAGLAWHYKEYEREQTPEDRELYARAEAEDHVDASGGRLAARQRAVGALAEAGVSHHARDGRRPVDVVEPHGPSMRRMAGLVKTRSGSKRSRTRAKSSQCG